MSATMPHPAPALAAACDAGPAGIPLRFSGQTGLGPGDSICLCRGQWGPRERSSRVTPCRATPRTTAADGTPLRNMAAHGTRLSSHARVEAHTCRDPLHHSAFLYGRQSEVLYGRALPGLLPLPGYGTRGRRRQGAAPLSAAPDAADSTSSIHVSSQADLNPVPVGSSPQSASDTVPPRLAGAESDTVPPRLAGAERDTDRKISSHSEAAAFSSDSDSDSDIGSDIESESSSRVGGENEALGTSSGTNSTSTSSSSSGSSSTSDSSSSGSSGSSSVRSGSKLGSKLRLKGSSKLRQWARTRSRVILRSEEAALREGTLSGTAGSSSSKRFDTMIGKDDSSSNSSSDAEEEEDAPANEIYVISDGTGWTADQAVQAALGQFDYCFVDGQCPVKTRLYQKVQEVDKLLEVLRLAGENRVLVVYTLVDPHMSDVARTACRVMQIPYVDMLGPILKSVEELLGVSATRVPRGAKGRKSPLSKEYFRRIEAVDFTIKQDDGAHPRNLNKADIVLVGVSRTGKTPLSIYLAQKGYKVANVPLVPGVPPPGELFAVDQSIVFALTIDPSTLQSIRRARFATLGLIPDEPPEDEEEESGGVSEDEQEGPGEEGSLERRIWQRRFGKGRKGAAAAAAVGGEAALTASQAKYYSLAAIKQELDQVFQLYRANPLWPVINVTGRAIEETAAEILQVRYERINKQQMPYISRRY